MKVRVSVFFLLYGGCRAVPTSTLSLCGTTLLVSIPDSHMHPPEKRVWPLSKGFLVFLSEH